MILLRKIDSNMELFQCKDKFGECMFSPSYDDKFHPTPLAYNVEYHSSLTLSSPNAGHGFYIADLQIFWKYVNEDDSSGCLQR